MGGFRVAIVATAALACLAPLHAAHADIHRGPNDAYVRIVDTGPGLCAIATIPGGHDLVYDTGHWVGDHCLRAVGELVTDKTIDILVLSHSDGDHVGQAAAILDEFKVRTIIRTGERHRPQLGRSISGAWKRANRKIGEAAMNDATVINLQTTQLVPGTTFALGNATLTLIAGWGRWHDGNIPAAEQLNAISIVAKLEYRGRSVLFTGDSIGRRLDDPDDACKDAERVMVDRHATGGVSLKADVLIAPHHGGNNGSSTRFIAAVDPLFVIFPAGHAHKHPAARAAQRYLAHGVALERMFRTDRGDDEGGYEWDHAALPGCKDGRGDDDVEIVLRGLFFGGWVEVAYRSAHAGC